MKAGARAARKGIRGGGRTVERRAPIQRRRDDRLFETLAKSAPVGIYVHDAEGKCIYVNPACCEIAGRSAEELRERDDLILHPDDREAVLAEWKRAIASRRPFDREFRVARPDGTVLWIRAKAAPITGGTGGYVGTLSDITANKHAQLSLLESEHRMQAMMDASPAAIMSMDLAGRTRDWNKSAQRLFGWAPDEATGQAALIVPPSGRAGFLEAIARVAGGERMIDKLELCQRKSGEVFIASLSAAPLVDGAGRVSGLVMVATDVTEQERMRGELSVLSDARQQLHQDLHDGCIQSLFAVGLRLENARLANAGNPGALVVAIDDAITNLNLLSQELRGFIAGSLRTGVTELRESLERAVRNAGDDRGPKFTIDIVPDAVETLSRDQLQQLLLISREGISNIIRHAGARVACISLRRKAGRIELEMRDDGVGFDPRVRGRNGHGLNYIAARARKLGARWRVESKRGKGTRVLVGLRG